MALKYDASTGYKPAIARVLEALHYWTEPDQTVVFTNRLLAAAVGLRSIGQIPAIRRQLVADQVISVIRSGPQGTKVRVNVIAPASVPSYPPISSDPPKLTRNTLIAKLFDNLLTLYAEGRLSLRQMMFLRKRLDSTYGGSDKEWRQLLYAIRPISREDDEHQRAIVPATVIDQAVMSVDNAARAIRQVSGQSTNESVMQLIAMYTLELAIKRPNNRALFELLEAGLSLDELHSVARASLELFRALAARAERSPRPSEPSDWKRLS